jgi:MFS family permease
MFSTIINLYRAAFQGLPREVWYLALAMFVNRSGSMVIPFLALYLHKEMGYTVEVSGWMVAIYGVGSVLGSFYGGFASDRWGPMRVQIGTLVANAAGLLLLSQMPNYASFAAVLVLTSMVGDAFRPANFAALTMLCPAKDHRRAFALNRLAANLGFSIGPPIGGILCFYSYQWLFWIDAATCLIAAAVMYVLLYEHHADLLQRSMPKPSETRRNPFGDLRFMLFVGLSIICFSTFFQLLSTYPLYLKDNYRLNELQIGFLFALNPALIGLFEMVLVHRIAHWNQMRTIAWGSLLMCVGFGILPFGMGLTYAVFGVLFYTLGEMLMMPAAMVHAAACSDEASRGRYVGVYTTGVSLAFILGPLFFAWIYGIDHNWGWYLTLAIGSGLWFGYRSLGRSRESDSQAADDQAPVADTLLPNARVESFEQEDNANKSLPTGGCP